MADVNLFSLMDRFNCDENCREVLEDIRWPDGPFCARCGAIDSRELPDGGKYYCRSCSYQFTVMSGDYHARFPPAIAQVVCRHLPHVRVEKRHVG